MINHNFKSRFFAFSFPAFSRSRNQSTARTFLDLARTNSAGRTSSVPTSKTSLKTPTGISSCCIFPACSVRQSLDSCLVPVELENTGTVIFARLLNLSLLGGFIMQAPEEAN